MLSLVLWAQTVSPDPTSTYSALGVAGLICAVLTVVWRQAESKLAKAETEIRDLNRQRLEDRDKLLPLAGDMVRVLGGATVAMERGARPDPSELEKTLGAIEDLRDQLRKRDQQ